MTFPARIYHQIPGSDATASVLIPAFLLTQDIYSQMFTGPTPSPVSLLQVGRERDI